MVARTVLLVVAFLALGVAASKVSFLYSIRTDDGCEPMTLGVCTPCKYNNVTTYTKCNPQGPAATCSVFRDAACTSVSEFGSGPRVKQCEQLAPCEVNIHLNAYFQLSVTAQSNITLVTAYSTAFTQVQLSPTAAIATGVLTDITFRSETSELQYLVAFDDGSYLTSAGTCQLDETCTVGDISYTGSVVPNVLPPQQDLSLRWDVGLGIRTNAEAFVSVQEETVNLNKESLSSLTLAADHRGTDLMVSDMQLENLDTQNPILFYKSFFNGVYIGYEDVECDWRTPQGSYASIGGWSYRDPYEVLEDAYIRCNLYDVFSEIEEFEDDGFASFYFNGGYDRAVGFFQGFLNHFRFDLA